MAKVNNKVIFQLIIHAILLLILLYNLIQYLTHSISICVFYHEVFSKLVLEPPS